MRSFFQPVDKRSRAAMTEYLAGHFRYNTMNSWNLSTSYAHCLKIHRLGLEADIMNKLFELIMVPEFFDPLNDLMREFGEEHDYRWQAGMNGRSGGYLVLYQGRLEPSGYKSYCSRCGQQNYKSVAESGNICGCCREPARRDYPKPHMRVVTYPGRGADQHEDFEDWALGDLRDRVSLVQSFDKLADAIVREAVWIAQNYDVREESYTVTKTRPVLVPAG